MHARTFQVFRKVALTSSCVCSVVVLALAAQVTDRAIRVLNLYIYFPVLAIAAASLTLLTLPVMLLIDMYRTGAVTSWVITELIWLSMLWMLWLATAANAADISGKLFIPGCDFSPIACHDFPPLTAFTFIIWFTLMSYTLTLLVFALIGHARGHWVWTSSIKQGDFLNAAVDPSSPQPSSLPSMNFSPKMDARSITGTIYATYHAMNPGSSPSTPVPFTTQTGTQPESFIPPSTSHGPDTGPEF